MERWEEIFSTLSRNLFRTLLTAFGVFWGIFMLVIMLGVGKGLENGVLKEFGGVATNSMFMWGSTTSLPYNGKKAGRYIGMTNADMDYLRENVEGIKYVCPGLQLGGYRSSTYVSQKDKSASLNIHGDYPEIRHVHLPKVTAGRFLNKKDLEDYSKVAVLGERAVELLFDADEDPIGQSIKVNGIYFQVVGIFKSSKQGGEAERDAQKIYIPFSTFQKSFNMLNKVGWVSIVGEDGYRVADLQEEIHNILAQRHDFDPADRQALGKWNAQKELDKLTGLFQGIKVFVWIVGIVTLLAGIVGVSNIMLITIKERTREIGVRKALGATPASIVGMIVQEALALTSMAGIFGLLFGVIVLEMVNHYFGQPEPGKMFTYPAVSFEAAMGATITLIVAGVLAGFIPASQAVSINPIKALRTE